MRIATSIGNSLVISALLMTASFFICYELIKQEQQVFFVGPVSDFIELKNERFENLNYELLTIESFFLSSSGVEKDELSRFVEPILEQNIIVNSILYYRLDSGDWKLSTPTYWYAYDGELALTKNTLSQNLSRINPYHMSVAEPVSSTPIKGNQHDVIAVVYKMHENKGAIVLIIDFVRAIRDILNNELSKDFFIYDENNKLIFKNIPESSLKQEYFVENIFFFDRLWTVKVNSQHSFRYYLYFLIPLSTLLFCIFLFYLFRYSVRLNQANKDTDEALTNLQFAQEKLIETEKIKAMGGLVAGISHEVNTPLGISITSASHQKELLDELKQDFEQGILDSEKFEDFMASSYDMADMTLTNLQRASKLVASFKRVAVINADDGTGIEQVDICRLIEDFIKGYNAHNPNHVLRFSTRFPAKAWVYTYPAVVTQILSHLTTNTLLHAFKPEQTECEVHLAIRPYKDGFAVRYSDNGVGVPQTELRKINEPFFTTKRGAGNAGLGLSVVYNMVKSKLHGDFNHGCAEGQGLWISFTIQNLEKE